MTQEMNEYVSVNVRAMREKNLWSQKHLAQAAGLDLSIIQRTESGKTSPSPDTMKALCEALQTTPDELRRPRARARPSPSINADTEQLVKLDLMNRASYVVELVARASFFRFEPTLGVDSEPERVAVFISNLVVGWAGGSGKDHDEAELELQSEMDRLASRELVLACGLAPMLWPNPILALPAISGQCLVVTVTRPSDPVTEVVIPKVQP